MNARPEILDSRRAGNALVIALLVVTTVAALSAGFMHITSSLATRQSVGIDSQRAFYIAEAGLAEGFQAVRMGRTGELGSATAPARFGERLLWVTATDSAEGQIRLESTALCGTGRASLALVLEPVDLALGFFADEDLVVNSVLLLDGYDSSVAVYDQSVVNDGDDDDDDGDDEDDGDRDVGSDGYESGAPVGVLGPNTGQGGLLSSNGNVEFRMPTGEAVEVWGDVTPGVGHAVVGHEGITVSGSTDPRVAEVELPIVEVPEVLLAPALRHDDFLPLLVPSGSSGYDEIVVGSGAEIVLRGPSTVVIGKLVLEPGAALSFDTRAGDVALYVLCSLDFQSGSLVANSNEAPNQTTVQVAATFDDPIDPAVKLDATAQFHGTVYAPDSNVRIGSQFEIFGGVVARRLEIGAGARLHYDHIGTSGSPIPRILSWQVVELPNEVQTVFGDPFRILGVERDSLLVLSDAHDLGHVQLDVKYVDINGTTRSWTGNEDQFDWSQVAELQSVTRDATREQEAPVSDPADEAVPRPVSVRQELADVFVAYVSSEANLNKLVKLAPFSAEEYSYLDAQLSPTDAELLRHKIGK